MAQSREEERGGLRGRREETGIKRKKRQQRLEEERRKKQLRKRKVGRSFGDLKGVLFIYKAINKKANELVVKSENI